MTLKAQLMTDNSYEQALGLLKPFLLRNLGNEDLILKGREFVFSISLIQNRVKTLFACRGGKVEILVNYWDKMFGRL